MHGLFVAFFMCHKGLPVFLYVRAFMVHLFQFSVFLVPHRQVKLSGVSQSKILSLVASGQFGCQRVN